MTEQPASLPPDALAEVYARERALMELGPLAAPQRLRRLAPFAGAMLATVLLMALDPDTDKRWVVLQAASTAVLLALALGLPWRRLPRRAQGALVLLAVLLDEPLLRVEGGLHSEFLAAMLLPLLWLALYENLVCLRIGLALTAALAAAEFVHAPALYMIWQLTPILVGLLMAPPIRHLVALNRAAVVALAELADRDALTGLLNRRGLDRYLPDVSDPADEVLGVLFLDIDRFKGVNDDLGHEAGDELLRQVAHRLVAATRSRDLVARVGGDEFVVICSAAADVAERIRVRVERLVNDEPYLLLGSTLVAAHVSVGFTGSNTGTSDPGAVLAAADHAMYRAKAALR